MGLSSVRRRLLDGAAIGLCGAIAIVGAPGVVQAQSATCSLVPAGEFERNIVCIDTSGTIATGRINLTTTAVNGGPGLVATNIDSLSGVLTATAPLHTELNNQNAIDLAAGANLDFVYNGSVTTLGDNASGYVLNATAGNIVARLGDAATSGTGSAGLVASGVNSTITIGNVSTAGAASDGISVVAVGGAANVIAGDVSTAGVNSNGVHIGANGSLTAAIGKISTAGDNSYGLRADAMQDITATVGDISTQGQLSQGAELVSTNGSILFTAGKVSTLGDGSSGIEARAAGMVALNAGDVSTMGADSAGIYAVGSDVTIMLGDVSTAGDYSTAVTAYAMTGAADIMVGNVSTSGSESYGVIVAAATTANVSIGDVSTAGDDSGGVLSYAIDSDIATTVGNVSTLGAGSFGANVQSFNGGVTFTVGNVNTSGTDSYGVLSESNAGAENRTSVGNVSTLGDDSHGIYVTGGIVELTAGDVSTSGMGSTGIYSYAASANNTIAGNISTMGDDAFGVQVDAVLAASVTVGNVTTSGNTSYGIDIDGDSVALAAGNVSTSGDGSTGVQLFADSSLVATIGDVSTAGDDSYGVLAFVFPSGGTTNRTTVGNVTTAGANSTAITARADSVTVAAGNVSTRGNASEGVNLSAFTGAANINVGNISTFGDDSSAASVLSGTSLTILAGNISTAGARSAGVYGVAGTHSSIAVGNVSTLGQNSAGIDLTANAGNAALVAGDVSTAGLNSSGVKVYAANGGASVMVGDVTTTGEGSTGIDVVGGTGAVLVGADLVNVTGAGARGIDVATTTGSQTISLNGVSATDLEAINAVAGNAAIAINANGDVTSTGASAIRIDTGGTSLVNAAGGADISGATGITSIAGGGSTINIAGSVTGRSGPSINADGGSAMVNVMASGVINGSVNLTDVADTLSNAGRLNLNGTSDYGLGTDALNNMGVVNAAGGTTLAGLEVFNNGARAQLDLGAGRTFFRDTTAFNNFGTINASGGATQLTSLATVANSGTINLADGAANDVLTITNGYHGLAGAQLRLDYSGVAIDRLVIGGHASGTTNLVLTPTADVAFTANSLLVVDTGTTTPGAFVLNAPRLGLIDFRLVQIDEDYYLNVVPNAAAFDPLVMGNVAQDIWYQSADIYTAQSALRRADLVGKRKHGFDVWGQLYISRDEYGGKQSATAFNSSYELDTGLETSRRGAQAGIDYAVAPEVVIGVTGGYLSSDGDLDLSGTGIEAKGYNIGAYVQAGGTNGLYGGLLAKRDWSDVDIKNPLFADITNDPDIRVFGVEGEIGYRVVRNEINFDFNAGLAYTNSKIDDFELRSIGFEFDHVQSLRGRLGARLGFDAGHLAPFVDAKLYHEFKGDSDLELVSGSASDTIEAKGRGTWGRLELGIGGNKGSVPTFSLWTEVGDVKGLGAKIGMRF